MGLIKIFAETAIIAIIGSIISNLLFKNVWLRILIGFILLTLLTFIYVALKDGLKEAIYVFDLLSQFVFIIFGFPVILVVTYIFRKKHSDKN